MIVQKTSAELVVYPHNLDPIAIKPWGDSQVSSGNSPVVELVAATTAKKLGEVGTWGATVKVPRHRHREFENSVIDGDWVDVILTRGPDRHHVMRGVVNNVDPDEAITGSGADTFTYYLSGFDHQYVFEKTPIHFLTFSAENLAGGAALAASVLSGRLFGLGGVRDTVTGILFGFLSVLNDYGRALWQLPAQMPGGGRPFAASCARIFDAGVDTPPRIAPSATLMSYDGVSIWQIASEWADAQFNELWCDLGRAAPRPMVIEENILDSMDEAASSRIDANAYLLRDSDALSPADTQMSVFLRERPFPSREHAQGLANGPWARIPEAMIHPGEVTRHTLHRNGDERFNTFEVIPPTTAEIMARSVPLIVPALDPEDIRLRGMRPMTMRSNYQPLPGSISEDEFLRKRRWTLVDWHCLNPYSYSGTLSLATMRPGIRVGQVACVSPNPTRLRGEDARNDVTAYVEGVRHTYRAPGKGATELTVTRGWRGGDEDRFQETEKRRSKFREPLPSLRTT